MTPADIIRGARADGVVLTLTPAGTIKATGDGAAVGRWLAAVREHKAQIIDLLATAANDQKVLLSNAPDPQAGIPCGGAAVTPCGGAAGGGTTTSSNPSNPDCWAWPHSSAMNSGEINTMQARLVRFTDRGLSMDEAERLADSLMRRDRDGWQAWVSCFECRHLQGAGHWRCANWRQADVPQAGLARDLVLNTARCAGFAEVAT